MDGLRTAVISALTAAAAAAAMILLVRSGSEPQSIPVMAESPAITAPVTVQSSTSAAVNTVALSSSSTTCAATTATEAASEAISETTTETLTSTVAETTTETATETAEETSESADEQEDAGTETETTIAPPDIYECLWAGYSPNSELYRSRLAVFGDSIAYGFNAFGYIPAEHNLAAESMAVWNMNSFAFDMGGGSMSPADAAQYTSAQIMFVMIGMNDVAAADPSGFCASYASLIGDLHSRLPDTVIIASAITPVSADCYYTSNDQIAAYNSAIQEAVSYVSSDRVLYFDSNSLLRDAWGVLDASYGGGDGIHLGSGAYSVMLTALYNYLDHYGIYDKL